MKPSKLSKWKVKLLRVKNQNCLRMLKLYRSKINTCDKCMCDIATLITRPKHEVDRIRWSHQYICCWRSIFMILTHLQHSLFISNAFCYRKEKLQFEDIQKRQREMEEKNKRKKTLLTKAIAERLFFH